MATTASAPLDAQAAAWVQMTHTALREIPVVQVLVEGVVMSMAQAALVVGWAVMILMVGVRLVVDGAVGYVLCF